MYYAIRAKSEARLAVHESTGSIGTPMCWPPQPPLATVCALLAQQQQLRAGGRSMCDALLLCTLHRHTLRRVVPDQRRRKGHNKDMYASPLLLHACIMEGGKPLTRPPCSLGWMEMTALKEDQNKPDNPHNNTVSHYPVSKCCNTTTRCGHRGPAELQNACSNRWHAVMQR